MPNRSLIEGHCYHTISNTRGRVPVFADDFCANVVVKCLRTIGNEKAYVLAYALMPDHLHLVVVPREPFTLPQVMQSIKGYASRVINEHRNQRGGIWQPSYYDRLIRTEEHLREAIAYVEHNPVAAGRVERPEDYAYSSAHPSAHSDIEAWLESNRRG